MRFEGRLASWNDERGFGFIQPTDGGQEIFAHVKAFPRGIRPSVDQPLSFELEIGPQGKKRAKNVQLVRFRPPPRRSPRQETAQWGVATLLVLPAFLLLYLAVAIVWRAPAWIAGLYVVLSLATFLAYAADKSASRRAARRTPESQLHLLAALGGWPGAVLAQQLLRHKTTKRAFRQTFWLTVAINVIALLLATSPIGRSYWAPS